MRVGALSSGAGWTLGAKGDGQRGRGFAYSRYKMIGVYAAVVVDVNIDRKSGIVRVPRVVIARRHRQCREPGWREKPARGRDRPGRQHRLEGTAHVRSPRDHQSRLGGISDPDVSGGTERRSLADESQRTIAWRRRRLARACFSRSGKRLRSCDGASDSNASDDS
jgi:hypothetical protein